MTMAWPTPSASSIPACFFDGGRYTSTYYDFLSPAIRSSLTMPIPSTGLGAGVALFPFENTYLTVGATDANGEKNSWGDLGAGELFYAIELGITPGYGTDRAGRYYVNFWRVDARAQKNIPSGQGFGLYGEQQFGQFVPFARYAQGSGANIDVRRSAVLGVGVEQPFGQEDNLFGMGLGWGEPTDRKKRDQYVFETFYRFQLTRDTQLTPDLQLIVNPADNPRQDVIAVGGIRLRTLF